MRETMPLKQSTSDLLEEAFGFSAFRPGQEAVINCLLAGRPSLAVFPTGGGKSLCYQLPALVFDGLTLVISPLIALMKDQVDALQQRGIPAARLDSSLTYEEVHAIHDRLADGTLKILYVAPERLANERFLNRLRRLRIALLAIDEAHCISEWGHNFRPDYLKIAHLTQDLRVGCVLALTATATPTVSADIRRAFGIAESDHIQTGFHRPNLTIRITPCAQAERRRILLERLRGRTPNSTIVYVTLQRTAGEIADFLAEHGLAARAYHAGLKNEQRKAVQDAFMNNTIRIVVATIAFGMGIDKEDIRAIYHFNLPKTLENYVQEIGRAGRDGKNATCELLANADDCTVLSNFTFGDTPTPESLRSLVEHLLGQSQTFDISRYELSARYDIRPLVVATVLTYLELDGVLCATGPFYESYKFQFNRPVEEILADFDTQRANFLRAVFDTARVGRIWRQLTPAETADTLNEPRERVVAAIGYLEERGHLQVQTTGLRYGYRLEQLPRDPQALIAGLEQTFSRRETQDIKRLEQVLNFARHDSCLARYLLSYFGEDLDRNCGHCTSCLENHPRTLPRTSPATLGAAEAEVVRQLQAEAHAALAHPRQMTRFLCGLTSPAATRARLNRHPFFGCLSEAPFQDVLAFVDRLGRV